MGGTLITITGTGLKGVKTVKFGNTPGTSLKSVSDTSVTVVSPVLAADEYDIILVTTAGITPIKSNYKVLASA